MTSPSWQAGESNHRQQYEQQVHRPFLELLNSNPWSDMPTPGPSTPPVSEDPLFNIHSSSPDSVFADSALLNWDYASRPLFPPAVGIFPDSKIFTVGQYTHVAPKPTMGAAGYPSPGSFAAHSPISTAGSSLPGNICPKEPSRRIAKRQMNTLAARRYRQRRLDRMNELEAELEAVKREREEWRVKASKLEGEASVLKRLLGSQKKKKEP